MIRPDKGKYVITQTFGNAPEYYGPGGHTGVDLGTPVGTELVAGVSGTVSHVVDHPTGGLFVQIKGDNYSVYTGHMKSSAVTVGDKVQEGQVIGLSGKSGVVFGPHVHWQIRDKSGRLINPLSVKLEKESNMEEKLNRGDVTNYFNAMFGYSPSENDFKYAGGRTHKQQIYAMLESGDFKGAAKFFQLKRELEAARKRIAELESESPNEAIAKLSKIKDDLQEVIDKHK